jgi:hypothetical protein
MGRQFACKFGLRRAALGAGRQYCEVDPRAGKVTAEMKHRRRRTLGWASLRGAPACNSKTRRSRSLIILMLIMIM